MYKTISKISISSELFQVEPLQYYVCRLAEYCKVPDNKMLSLQILVEEVITHIIKKACNGKSDETIELTVSYMPGVFVLSFHYWGLPFGYDIDKPQDEGDFISMQLIRKMGSSYKMKQDGKAGQTVEIQIALNLSVEERKPLAEVSDKALATDEVSIRKIEPDDMESLVQCLYSVFGYSYSADDVYFPDAIRKKLVEGSYDGIVAVNTSGAIVAHVAMLKDSPSDMVCECGQAFVLPTYGRRGLFATLKERLLEVADQKGLYGVYSSAIASHPYTQKANLALGCVEVGLELAYILADLQSFIDRDGKEERQSVVSFFHTLSRQNKQKILVPAEHCDIIRKTYELLAMDRDFVTVSEQALPDVPSEIESSVKTAWNQVHIKINNAGSDLLRHIDGIIRRSMASGCVMCYLSLPMCREFTPAAVYALQKMGFFYSGILPYGFDGGDMLRMQCLLGVDVSPEYVVTASEWGNELKNYVFMQKNKYNIC